MDTLEDRDRYDARRVPDTSIDRVQTSEAEFRDRRHRVSEAGHMGYIGRGVLLLLLLLRLLEWEFRGS
jgi:hypothetical protein